MNLLTDHWIPVRRKGSETVELIRPYEVVDRLQDNPVVAIESPRKDFSGALIQFLIGFIQTIMTPEDELEWVETFLNPPTTDEIQKRMEPLIPLFDLNSTEVRFMQETGMENPSIRDISSLLIDAPGENTIKNNTDHFVKRNQIKGMCEVCAATALFTLNTNAPTGGQGHYVSIRGGGPLTIIAIPENSSGEHESLWHTIYLNILTKQKLQKTKCNDSLTSFEHIFPWVFPNRDRQDTAIECDMNTIHPLHTFWGMPRRIILIDPEPKLGTCNICGKNDVRLYSQYGTRPQGIRYAPGILHPMSPYYTEKKSGLLLSDLPKPGGFTYRHWPLYITSNNPLKPRPITLQALDDHIRHLKNYEVEITVRVKLFGYDMDNMKARCWYESEMPYWLVPEEIRDAIADYSSRMAEATEYLAVATRYAVKDAWFSKKTKVRGLPDYVAKEIWSATEKSFYQSISHVIETLSLGIDDGQAILEQWISTIGTESLKVFDRFTEQVSLDSGVAKDDIPRVISARNNLIKKINGKKMRETILGLPRKKG